MFTPWIPLLFFQANGPEQCETAFRGHLLKLNRLSQASGRDVHRFPIFRFTSADFGFIRFNFVKLRQYI